MTKRGTAREEAGRGGYKINEPEKGFRRYIGREGLLVFIRRFGQHRRSREVVAG